MYVLEKIKLNIAENINKALGKNLIQASLFVYPPNSEMGDLSLSCFDLAKKLEKNPAEVASDLVSKIKSDKMVSSIKAIGPYLNFVLNKNYLAKNIIGEIMNAKDKYGKNEKLKGSKIMVEFAHPNPFKAFHIGHLRNILLGESISRIIESRGAKVIRVNYQGDVGMHIAKCLWAFKDIDKKDYPKTTDERVALIGKCYIQGAKVFEEDPVSNRLIVGINKQIYSKSDKEVNRLWELGKGWSLDKFHEIYKRLDTYFEREYMESEMIKDSFKLIKKAEKKGILEKSDGAIIFNGKNYNLDTRVFLNSEGLPTYEGKELALAYKEFKDFGKIDLCIHNVAVEQISFFDVTFKVEELLDAKKFKGKQYHNAYEFVGLKAGKMSSRKGEVVLGNDILNEAVKKIEEIIESRQASKKIEDISEKVGVGAIKYSFLKVSPFKYLAFDMEESINFSGDSGPYLQYSYARIKSIIKKSGIKKFKFKELILDEEKEASLILQLAKYPEIIERAGNNYDPSEISKYLFDLAQGLNDYYHSVPVLKVKDDIKNSRLILISSVAQVIKNGLSLLGVEVIDEM